MYHNEPEQPSSMDSARDLILQSEELLLFLVIAIGFLVGQIKVKGFSLGVSGVLFVGLFFGAWSAEGQEAFHIAEQVMHVGLILFVYAVGLSSGPGFFSSLKARGLRFNAALLIALISGAVLTLWLGLLMGLPEGQIAGIYCGGLTNTPALAAVTELMQRANMGDPSDAVVGYSIAYPYGILGGMLSFQIFAWFFRKSAITEKAQADAQSHKKTDLKNATFEITNSVLFNKVIGELEVQKYTGLIISRHRHGETIQVPTKYTILHEGDIVDVVGASVDVDKAETYFGTASTKSLKTIGGPTTVRRILMSRKKLAGLTIEQLDLGRRFNAQVTRLRRADIDIIPTYDEPVEIGDRLRVVMPTERAKDVADYFGDSERSISELDYTAITLGISLGVLIGMIPLKVPGGTAVSLGFAGGPLVAGLILGKLGRTGPIVWSIPLESNHTLRHIGLLFFLAAVGVMAGGRFLDALSNNGWQLLLLGVGTTTVTTGLMLLLLRYLGKASVVSAIGATSGMQTQPATLARAYDMSKSDETYVSYAITYPVAMVGKILIAQLIIIIARAFL
jgi:putative transport protein